MTGPLTNDKNVRIKKRGVKHFLTISSVGVLKRRWLQYLRKKKKGGGSTTNVIYTDE